MAADEPTVYATAHRLLVPAGRCRRPRRPARECPRSDRRST